jgi:hypothetical protein
VATLTVTVKLEPWSASAPTSITAEQVADELRSRLEDLLITVAGAELHITSIDAIGWTP